MMVFRALLWTGMCPADAFRLTAEDVYPDRIETKDTKTGPRTIALADAIKDFPRSYNRRRGGTPCQKQKGGGRYSRTTENNAGVVHSAD